MDEIDDLLGPLEDPPRHVWTRVLANALSIDPDIELRDELSDLVPEDTVADTRQQALPEYGVDGNDDEDVRVDLREGPDSPVVDDVTGGEPDHGAGDAPGPGGEW